MDIIGVDTGGTFTDFIYRKDNRWGIFKQLSTPADPSESVLSGLSRITSAHRFRVIHGSTVATNAILERKGAKTALVTTVGFEDVFAIGRQNRGDLYDPAWQKPPLLVPPALRFGVGGRISSDGSRRRPFDRDGAGEVARKIARSGVESVAVCFLFSFLDPSDELEMEKILLSNGMTAVSLSHRVLAEFREFERTSTTVVNAYVAPIMQRYLSRITTAIHGNDLRIMQSNGGSISAATAMGESVRTILSGPAGGVVGAWETGKTAGIEKLITFDMGGTSTDVCLINDGPPLTFESTISDFPIKVPMIDIHTVGAGGGSIARMDAGGALVVGPESAGADPGPACYGRGNAVTVTDAHLFLGRLVPDHFLGGHMTLDSRRMNRCLQDLAGKAGLSPGDLAEGILAVADTAMERAIRVISVERGFDPSEFTLFSFGGAGGLHAVSLARLLNIPRVMIPKNPGILSAVGMIMADVIKDYSLTVMIPAEGTGLGDLEDRLAPLTARGLDEMADEGISRDRIRVEPYLDMRYRGQSYEILVPFSDGYKTRFHALHEKRYGYAARDRQMEIVNLRVRVRGMPVKPEMTPEPEVHEMPVKEAFAGKTPVVFDGKPRQTDLILREHLRHGNRIQGPAIVIEYTSTLVMPPDTHSRVDALGNLIIHTRKGDH